MAPTGNKKQNTNGAAADRSAKDMLRVPAHLVRWAEALFFDGESSVFRIQGLPVSPPDAHLILSFHQPPGDPN